MDKSEKFWDKLSNNSDNLSQQLGLTESKTIENTKKYLNASDIVFDYGCGTGTMSHEIADDVKEIHAIDISSGMIDVAKRRAANRKIENINFVQSTLFDERYEKESFNVILAFNILHYLEDTQKVMQRINTLLKPEGLFISATACPGEKKTLLSIFLSLLIKIGVVPHMRFFKISELKTLITNGNFKIVETEVLSHTLKDYFVVAKKI